MTDPEPGVDFGDARRSLSREVRSALLAEIGTRETYTRLAPRVEDEELARLLRGMADEGGEAIAAVRAALGELGGQGDERGRRRRLRARCLAASSRWLGARAVLRVSAEDEQALARGYDQCAVFLAALGERSLAERFQRLADQKRVRAQALAAWIGGLRRS